MTSPSKSDAKRDPTVAFNRRARYDYHLGERYEAGLALHGTEVKSLRAGKASLAEAWVKVDDAGEAWLMQAHIPEYEYGHGRNHDPIRRRKLLLHKREIDELGRAVREKGAVVVPLRVYFRDGRAKVEIAVAKGKATHDKRRANAERDAARDVQRALKSRTRQ